MFHPSAEGSVSFNFAKREAGRMFHAVHGDGVAIELDATGKIECHRDTPEGRTAEIIGEVPQAVRDRLWALFHMECDHRKFDCHMAVAYVAGQELSAAVEIPHGEPLSLGEAVQRFGTPCGMQIQKRGEVMPRHSAVILSCAGPTATEGNTIAYHKRGRNQGEILPVGLVLQRYKFDPQRDELLFYAFPRTTQGG